VFFCHDDFIAASPPGILTELKSILRPARNSNPSSARSRVFSNFPGRGDQPGKLPIIPFSGNYAAARSLEEVWIPRVIESQPGFERGCEQLLISDLILRR
jgi:hypothetical protein